MVHALTRLELGAEAARRTVLFGAFFPTAFFLLAPYTEPLFLLLSIAAFWLLISRVASCVPMSVMLLICRWMSGQISIAPDITKIRISIQLAWTNCWKSVME